VREKFFALVLVTLLVSLLPSRIKVCVLVEDNRVVKSLSKDLGPIRMISMNDVSVANTHQKFEHARLYHQRIMQFLEVFLVVRETKALVLTRLCYERQIVVDCKEFFLRGAPVGAKALCSAKVPCNVKTLQSIFVL